MFLEILINVSVRRNLQLVAYKAKIEIITEKDLVKFN